jgi:hypothetical protein
MAIFFFDELFAKGKKIGVKRLKLTIRTVYFSKNGTNMSINFFYPEARKRLKILFEVASERENSGSHNSHKTRKMSSGQSTSG